MDYRTQAEAALKEARELFAKAEEVRADEALTDAEKRESVEKIEADAVAKNDEARSYVERGERAAQVTELMSRAGALGGTPDLRSDAEKDDLNAQLRAVAGGDAREIRLSLPVGIGLRTNDSAATGTATTTAGPGGSGNAGTTVHTTFINQLIESLRESSPIFKLARVITTSGGEPIQYPKRTAHTTKVGGTGNAGDTGFKVSEGNKYGKGSSTLSSFTLGSNKYGVIVEVSKELVEDSALDIAGLVAMDAGTEVGRAVATDAVAKLVTDLTLSPVALTTVPTDSTYGDALMTLYHSIVTGYRGSASWLMNDATALGIRKVKDTQGRTIWQPGLIGGQPDVLLARPVETDYNVAVPNTVAAAKTILFGDLSKFIIRQVNDLRIVRSDEYGFDRDVVAFKVTWRGDFGLSDTQAVNAIQVAQQS